MSNNVHKFIKKRALDMFMYGFVVGIRTQAPTVSVDKCIEAFILKNDLDDYPLDRARRMFTIMQQDHMDFLKSNT